MKKQSNVTFYKGLPPEGALAKYFKPHHHGILIPDDLMEESGNDKRVLDLFTKDFHHRGITALYLTQDLFPPDKYSKTINRNAHYAICFKSPRDKTGIRNLLLQVYADKWRRVLKLFLRLTARAFGYFMLDLHPVSDDRFRVWSQHKRQQKLRYANADQINAVSELVLNTLRGAIRPGQKTKSKL